MSRWIRYLPSSVREWVDGSVSMRRITLNTSWLMLERVVSMIIRFGVGIWLIRYLGPDRYGVYVYALSFVALFNALATIGLDSIVIRDLTRNSQSQGSILTTAFTLQALGAALTYGLLSLIVLTLEESPLIRGAVLIAAGQLLFIPGNVTDLWFQARIQSKYSVWVRSAVTIIISAGQVAFILLDASLLPFVWLTVFKAGIIAVGLGIVFWRKIPSDWTWQFNRNVAKEMLRQSWPLLIASLSIAVYMRIDQVMLRWMTTQEVVGQYGAAARLSELWYFIPTSIAGSVFPEIVRLQREEKRARYESAMQGLYDIMALVSYIIVIPTALLATPLVALLLGDPYLPAAPILQVHIWAFVFVALGTARSRWLVAEDLVKISMCVTVLSALSNIALNFLLIPFFSGLGAAWATLISYALAVYLLTPLFRSMRITFFQMSKALLIPVRLLP